MSEPTGTSETSNGETPAPSPPPGGAGLVVVVGPPRCGVTSVFDALRCHPYARFERASAMFGRLTRGAHNRYPRDLCLQSGGIRVEQKKGDVVRVPSFGWTEEENVGGWMVEKLHPHFYLHEVEWLIARVEQLEAAGAPVRVVLRIREPRAMLRSQWLYKHREPTWQSWLAEESMVGFARQSYESMARFLEQRPGSVVSVYEHDTEDRSAALKAVYDALWAGEDWGELASEVCDRTSIKSRGARAAMRFTAQTDNQDTAPLDALLKKGATDVRACEKAYRAVVGE